MLINDFSHQHISHVEAEKREKYGRTRGSERAFADGRKAIEEVAKMFGKAFFSLGVKLHVFHH